MITEGYVEAINKSYAYFIGDFPPRVLTVRKRLLALSGAFGLRSGTEYEVCAACCKAAARTNELTPYQQGGIMTMLDRIKQYSDKHRHKRV
jgi:hypothetical protein